MRIKELFDFCYERQKVHVRRFVKLLPPPWTKDPILREFRFANVYREQDTVTRWIHDVYIKGHEDDPLLWFALAVARNINWPPTLKEIGYPVPFNGAQVLCPVWDRMRRGEKTFTSAYIISGGNEGDTKINHIVGTVLMPLWAYRGTCTGLLACSHTLAEAHRMIKQWNGFGTFLAGQLVADLKHTRILPESKVSDWWDFAVPGPGSKRGMNRLLGLDPKDPWDDKEFVAKLKEVREKLLPMIHKHDLPPLDLHDTQGWLCEFDKYERCREGGRTKERFKGEQNYRPDSRTS